MSDPTDALDVLIEDAIEANDGEPPKHMALGVDPPLPVVDVAEINALDELRELFGENDDDDGEDVDDDSDPVDER
jgi:hypothetical protein